MEWPKWESYRSFADPAIQILEQLHHELPETPVLLDLGFFKMFLWGLAYWEESQHDWHLLSVMNNVRCKLRQAVKEFTAQCECADNGDCITKWWLRTYHLECRIQQYKPPAKEICTLLLDEAFRCKSCPQEEELFLEYGRDTASYIEFFRENLEALNSKIYATAAVKQQIKVITRSLKVFGEHVDRAPHWINRVNNLGEHVSQTRTWVNHLSCLACLYWIDRRDKSAASTVGTMIFYFLQKTMPYTPGIIASYLEECRIQQYKPQAKEICALLLGNAFRCKSCPHQEMFLEYGRDTASFIEFVWENLEALDSKFHLFTGVKQQINFITMKPKLLGKFANPVSHWMTRVNNLVELVVQTRTSANHFSCLPFLYWIDGMDETLAFTLGTMLSDLMYKTTSCTSGVVDSYFEGTLILQLVTRYLDFLLEELDFPPAKDDIETLREGLIFLFSFVMDPPEKDSEDTQLILGQISSIINELPFPICSIHYNQMKERISETKLLDFLEKVAVVKVEVRKLHAVTPNSSQFNSPRTNAIGFLDSLLQKLEKWLKGELNLIAHVKHGIQIVWEELAWLRCFMKNITELKNEQENLKDIWARIVDVVYYASYITNLCPSTSFPPWYGMICLTIVIEKIKLIKNEIREINDRLMCKSRKLSDKTESRDTLQARTTTSNIEGAFIGFREETDSVIDHLIGGRKNLTIISISGMPGQGKTTLAKRIYNDPKIQYYFHKTVWCYVSKECKIRDLMIDILHDVCKIDVENISKLEIQDLAEILRKSLKGKKYLIVMDDIWDDEVWCQVQSSFPDDGLGSRILFTSRNCNLKSQDGNFISYPLRLFSEEESWDLMKENINGLGTEFEEIGKEIAKSCKGLPLAVVLVASLLGKTEQKLKLWKQVADKLKSHLASEGCMHIIELSYKYLPDYLKSCFLYFGAFPRGKNIHAKRLKLLWISEGFIKENETRCSEDLAEECLDDLVSQSLVVVAERSSKGAIKTCNVHDLLYDLCLGKIAEDNFLHWIDWYTIRHECLSSTQKYSHHRLCIGGSDPFIEARPICGRNELPTCAVQSLLWFDRFSGNDVDRVTFGFLKSFKVLTVLDLEDVEVEGDVFPEVILSNIHLKYVALRERIKNIPPSIAELWNLETLILIGVPYGGIIKRWIPDTMWRMKSLRHVRIDGGCLSLEDLEGNEAYMSALDNMETLCGLFIGDDPRTVEFLGRMTRLRKLKCVFEGDVLYSIFGSLKILEELKFSSYFVCLQLDYFGPARSVFETCSSFLQNKNLEKLSLELSKVASWSAISTIGKHLPNLEVLKLRGVKCVGSSRRWDLEDGEFSNLRYLKLSALYGLEEINVSVDCDNPFPCLEVLIVDHCPSLNEIPSEIGEIGSLNTIKMSWCSREASESVMQILEQQRDLGNQSLQVFVTELWYWDVLAG